LRIGLLRRQLHAAQQHPIGLPPHEERALRARVDELRGSLEVTRRTLVTARDELKESRQAHKELDHSLSQVTARERANAESLAAELQQAHISAFEHKELSDFLSASLVRAELAAAAAEARCQQASVQSTKLRGRLVADSTALRARVSELEALVGAPKQISPHPPMSSLPPVPGASGKSPGAARRALRLMHTGSGGVGWHDRGWRAKRSEWLDEDESLAVVPLVAA
jgi:hypothetical protein